MADIKIRVGASVDSDLSNIFRPIRDEARRTRQQISSDQRIFEKAAAADALAVARNRYKEESRLNREFFKANVSAERDAMKQSTQLAAERIRKKTSLEVEAIRTAAAAQRNADQIASREKIAQMRTVQQESRRLASSAGGGAGLIGYFGGRHVVSGAGRNFSRMVGGAAGLVGQVGRGLGIDFDMASTVRRNVERDVLAREITNSAYMPGAKGPAGERQDFRQIQKEAEETGHAARIDPTGALQGVQKFVKVAGDLDTARKTMKELAFLSQATGSELSHVAEAAGNVAAQFADSPDKAERVLDVMRTIAGQGKLGAVELSDMAKQMAAVAANAGAFAGKPEDAIKSMGALAQIARQHGGAKSASEATFSMASFVQTFAKPARVAAMKAAGIDPMNEHHQIKDIGEIITAMMVKSGGDPVKLNAMVKDARANRAIAGFQHLYNNTYSSRMQGESKSDFKKRETAAKVEAVMGEYNRFKTSMGAEEIRKSAEIRMDSPAAKAQEFQNQLDDVGKKIMGNLLPALEKMGPDIIRVTSALGEMAAWLVGNPLAGAFTALGLSIAKAGIGEMIARIIGTSITGQLAGNVAGGIAGSSASAAAGLAGLAINLGMAGAAISALGLAAWQAQKLWNETHTNTSHPEGMSDEDKDRDTPRWRKVGDKWISPEEDAKNIKARHEQETAVIKNKHDLTEAGLLDKNLNFEEGRGNKNPAITPEVLDAIIKATNQDKVAQLTDEQTKMMRTGLHVHITNIAELKGAAGDNPGGADGFKPPPPIPTAGTNNTWFKGNRFSQSINE